MEKMICASCGATITPATNTPFLTCAYCDTAVENPYYSGAAAVPAAADMDAQCVALLTEMGATARLPDGMFGVPLTSAYAAREGLEIPGGEQVYFAFAHSTIWKTFSEGFALTDTGMYYLEGGSAGKRTWEAFATGEISGTPYGGWGQDGLLRVGGATFPLNSSDDNSAAEFLVDFHHRCYRIFTGETAPSAWSLTDAAATAAETTSLGGGIAAASVAGTVLTAARTLLGHSVTRNIVPRTTLHHPAARQASRRPPAPPRSMDQRPARPDQPHQLRSGRPAGMGRPGGMSRPGMGGRGPGGRGPGGMGGPGRGRR